MYGYIYLTTNLINNKIYIGQHTSDEFDAKYKGSGVIIQKAIHKYGWDNFSCEILCECQSQEELNDKEIQYISQYDSTNKEIGYNIKFGGSNSPCPESVRKKISDTQKKNPNRSMLGKTHTDETRCRMSKKALGRKVSDISRERMRKSKLGNTNNHGCNRGREWMNNSQKELFVDACDISTYLQGGWVFGRLPISPNALNHCRELYKNRQYINNGTTEKYVYEHQIQEYLNSGWVVGKIPNYMDSRKEKNQLGKKRKNKNNQWRISKIHI